MRVGEDAAEVRVAVLRLAEQRHVRLSASVERHLGAGDRPDAEVLRRVGELERAVDAVVVGERERVVAELGGARGELLRQRGAVEERVRRMCVQLDIRQSVRRTRCTICSCPIRSSVARASGELHERADGYRLIRVDSRADRRDRDRLRRDARRRARTLTRTMPIRSSCSRVRSSSPPATRPCVLGPGSFITSPPGARHGFRSAGGRARVLNFHTPGGGFTDSIRETTRGG